MFETLVNAFKIKEIRHKIYFTILLLIVYRLGCYIPVPGIDAEALATQITGNDFLSIMNGITGGALANGTLFAMGIGPYINASIIMQLLTVGIPALERLSKQGEDGRKKIAQYTRYFTMALAIIQAVGILVGFGGSGLIDSSVFPNAQWLLYIFIVIIFPLFNFTFYFIGKLNQFLQTLDLLHRPWLQSPDFLPAFSILRNIRFIFLNFLFQGRSHFRAKPVHAVFLFLSVFLQCFRQLVRLFFILFHKSRHLL